MMKKISRSYSGKVTPGKATTVQMHTLFSAGLLAQQRGDLAAAKAQYEALLQREPEHAAAHQQLGVIAHQTGQSQTAIELLNRALELDANDAGAHLNLGIVLRDLKSCEAALECYRAAEAINPNIAELHVARGIALNDLCEHHKAIDSYNRAIALNARLAIAHFNRGNAQRALAQHQAAVFSYNRAIELQPDLADAFANKANALVALGQAKAAVICIGQAITLKPLKAEYFLIRANILKSTEMFSMAIADLNNVIELDKDCAKAYVARAEINNHFQRYEEVIEDYKRARVIDPDLEYIDGSLISAMNAICQWSEYDELKENIMERIRLGKKVIHPLTLLGMSDDPMLQEQCTLIYPGKQLDHLHKTDELQSITKTVRKSNGKIKIGYYSTDFHEHPVMHLMEKVFELHDRSKFELVGFYLGQDIKDDLNKAARKKFDRFINIDAFSDNAISDLSKDIGIDIAIDLNGFTGDSKTNIFIKRCAPVQINFLGYPGTSGLKSMDYMIADKFIITDEYKKYASENIIYLPDCYQPNNSDKEISTKKICRKDFNLPDDHFIFCCFNNLNKINPDVFYSWMRIMNTVPQSTLWLFSNKPVIIENLRAEAAAKGINPDRLVFAGRMPLLADHLARYRLADLFLDTFPYNAHTTASDSLWGGCPVLTRAGKSYVSRVAGSLLTAVGLPDLITETIEEYEAKAIRLATHPDEMMVLKDRLAVNRFTHPLFDTVRFTVNLEAALTRVFERHLAGQAPGDIVM